MRRWLLLLILLTAAAASARQVGTTEFAGVTYMNLADFGAALGSTLRRVGPSVVVRSGSGVLTVFSGSSDYVWQAAGSSGPEEARLSVPVREEAGELWAPLELVEAVGGSVSGIVAVMPDRTRLLLEESPGPGRPAAAPVPQAAGGQSLTVQLANGVRALQLRTEHGSLLLVDAGLLGLAFPEQRQAFDGFNTGAHGFRPLYFVFTAETETEFAGPVRFRQRGLQETAAFEGDIAVLEGDAATVSPGSPLSGLLLLPVTADLRRPLQVEWAGMSTEFSFRR